jgi:hypothetical protein
MLTGLSRFLVHPSLDSSSVHPNPFPVPVLYVPYCNFFMLGESGFGNLDYRYISQSKELTRGPPEIVQYVRF